MTLTNLAVEHLLTVRFDTTSTMSEGGPVGTRILVNVTGGEFSGRRLRGTVVAGSDWVVRRADGTLVLDVRSQLRSDDGVTILMTYGGLATRDSADRMRVNATPRFEAPCDSPHAWLNDEVCIARGEVGRGSVAYEVFALR